MVKRAVRYRRRFASSHAADTPWVSVRVYESIWGVMDSDGGPDNPGPPIVGSWPSGRARPRQGHALRIVQARRRQPACAQGVFITFWHHPPCPVARIGPTTTIER